MRLQEKGALDLMATTDLVGGGGRVTRFEGGEQGDAVEEECDGDLSGEGTEKEEAFRGKGMTHLEEKMKVTVGVGRWDSQSLFGGIGYGVLELGRRGSWDMEAE